MTALEVHEQRRLDICEERIKRGLATFVDVGKALTEIRDERLYRDTHGTFEDYCRERWGFTDRRARQMIEAAEIGSMLPVGNARQANELARVPEDDRADVWAEVNERTVNQPTAAAIRDVRNERYPEPPRADPTPTPPSGQTPRARDLPQADPPAVEDSAVPAPSAARPSPDALARHERERAAQVSRQTATDNLAKSVWLIAGQAEMDEPVDRIISDWLPEHDIYPKPTTAERLKTAADYLFALSERWPW